MWYVNGITNFKELCFLKKIFKFVIKLYKVLHYLLKNLNDMWYVDYFKCKKEKKMQQLSKLKLI